MALMRASATAALQVEISHTIAAAAYVTARQAQSDESSLFNYKSHLPTLSTLHYGPLRTITQGRKIKLVCLEAKESRQRIRFNKPGGAHQTCALNE